MCCVGAPSKEDVVGLVRRGCRRLLLCPVVRQTVEGLRQQAVQDQEQAGDEQVRSGLQALQLVAVPSRVCDATATELLHALWPPGPSASSSRGR